MSLHEDFHRKPESRGASDRNFGAVFTVFWLLVGLAPLRARHPARWWAVALAVLFLAAAWLRPAWLHPLNRVWTGLGVLLGRVVSPVVTGLLFYLVVTPMGLWARWRGKDPLHRRFDREAASYWIERRPAGPAPDTMTRQF